MSKRCGLYCNINKRKKAGKSRSKKNSTISPKAYANMKAGFPKKKKTKKMIVCPDCTPAQQYVLERLQTEAEVTDKTALAVIMGNIQQESRFTPNICEGGEIIPYDQCLRGGYGLIQWTSPNRYHGLGLFCKRYECDPSSLEGRPVT